MGINQESYRWVWANDAQKGRRPQVLRDLSCAELDNPERLYTLFLQRGDVHLHQENAFEFSDIAHFAIRILEENPEVAASYRDRYHEVMVDEYQDNSHTQERMLELLSNGHNPFMVGDIKQSIYRFRQADPQIFNGKFQLFLENPDAGKLILLKENFRIGGLQNVKHEETHPHVPARSCNDGGNGAAHIRG